MSSPSPQPPRSVSISPPNTPPLTPAGAAGTPRSDRESSASRSGTSPIPVPLIVPRYQKKTRMHNEMSTTDTAKSAVQPISATEMLRQRSIEALTIRSGKVSYGDEISYQAYAMYRHGRHQYHTTSVGYSSEGDLVLTKEEISSSSEAEPNRFERQYVAVTGAVCLNPRAKRALTDDEMTSRRKVNPSKLKKYPGVKAPRNKKLRNRLMNDHFANTIAREIKRKAKEDEPKGSEEGVDDAAVPCFPECRAVSETLHKAPDKFDAIVNKFKVSPTMRPTSIEKHPDSAEFRFMQLSQRLKDEIKHAVKNSETLTGVIAELETAFSGYITEMNRYSMDSSTHSNGSKGSGGGSPLAPAPAACGGVSPGMKPSCPPLELFLHDSYCRLICYGVAQYYRLNCASEEFEGAEEGVKKTIVTLPAKSDVALPMQSLLSFLKGRPAMEKFSLDDDGAMDPPEFQPEELTKTQRKKMKKLRTAGVHQSPSKPSKPRGEE